MPGLSVVDDDNGVGGPQASGLTFKHANFRQSALSRNMCVESERAGAIPGTIAKLASPTTCGPYWLRHKFRPGASDKPT